MGTPLFTLHCGILDLIEDMLDDRDLISFTEAVQSRYFCPGNGQILCPLERITANQDDLRRMTSHRDLNRVLQYCFYAGDDIVNRTTMIPCMVSDPRNRVSVTCRLDVLDIETIGLTMYEYQGHENLDMDWLCENIDVREFFRNNNIDVPRGVYANPVDIGSPYSGKHSILASEINYFRMMGLCFLEQFDFPKNAVTTIDHAG